MPTITDPYPALVSFQHALDAGEIHLASSKETPGLYSYVDSPTGADTRLTFVHRDGSTVSALVMLAHAEPYRGRPCYAVGYAVPLEFRGQGRAKKLLTAVLQELRVMLKGRGGPKSFFLEAVIAQSNVASQKVAEHVLGAKAGDGHDSLSGEPIFQYLLEVNQ
ncbi:GNAT family N-acetyltransferase [Acidocella facilis]|uniref:GNAT family N-acetyltransferase n=1 Tax=Acidocella facilis TaxID=525 RepID=UPI001F44447F|nr:GNAT family N-acetyltransferase [Acidocella facilis]